MATDDDPDRGVELAQDRDDLSRQPFAAERIVDWGYPAALMDQQHDRVGTLRL